MTTASPQRHAGASEPDQPAPWSGRLLGHTRRFRAERPVAFAAIILGLLLTLGFLEAAAGTGYLGGVDLGTSTDEAITRLCPGPDACYYLVAGKDFLETGGLAPENRWIVNLWPPGAVGLSALYVAIARLGIPIAVVAGFIGIAAWTAVLTGWYSYLRRRVGDILGLGATILVAVGQPVRDWYLADGLFYMESPSIAAFLAALLLILMAAESQGRRRAAFAAGGGVLLALAAYLRAVFELAALALTGFALVTITLAVLISSRKGGSLRTSHLFRAGALLALTVLAFHLLTMPWRVVASSLRDGGAQWTQQLQSQSRQLWMSTEYIEALGIQWLIDGTQNTACRVNPEQCSKFEQVELASDNPYSGQVTDEHEFFWKAVETMLTHPVSWTAIKTEAFFRYWFDDDWRRDSFEFFENGVLFVLLVLLLALGLKRLPLPVALTTLAVLLAVLGSTFLFHFEIRYLYPIKSLVPVVGVMCLPRGVLDRFRVDPDPASQVVSG